MKPFLPESFPTAFVDRYTALFGEQTMEKILHGYDTPRQTWFRINPLKVTIPDGYEVEELPESKIFMLPEKGARYIYSVSQMGSAINIMSNLQVNKTIFAQTQYPNLREFYNQVVAKQAEMIVLKKKQ